MDYGLPLFFLVHIWIMSINMKKFTFNISVKRTPNRGLNARTVFFLKKKIHPTGEILKALHSKSRKGPESWLLLVLSYGDSVAPSRVLTHTLGEHTVRALFFFVRTKV